MKTTNSLLSLLALAPLLAACGHRGPEAEPPRPVRVEAVQGAPEPGRLRYSATIQAAEQVPLAFRVSGYVQELTQRAGLDGRRALQQGDDVARGAVLARVNQADYRERVNQARGQVAEAAANLEKTRADAERAERLYTSQSLTRPEYDAARAGLAMASARAQAAQAQLDSAQISLRDTALVAPMSGVVIARQVEVGSLAAPGTVGYVVADLTRVKAVFGVPDRLIDRARTGLPLSITSDAFGDTVFPGRITAVSPSADNQSRVFSVEVTIDNPKRLLKPGMIASVEVPAVGSVVNVHFPTVGLAAVVKAPATPAGYAVYVAEGPDTRTVVRSRAVTLGPMVGNRVSVTDGLRTGERVVVTGASLLHDGDVVRVIPGGTEN